ncbi:MAG TPA: VTT domain-containing protein [Terriglobales bacterium]|nr:VTT domain-containing protein [Terriglobales bacterium]
MKTIAHILSRYVNFLKATLAPLGIFGVFAIAAIDGAMVGMPIDALVAYYVYQHRATFLLYVLMAAAGSTVGSLVIYAIGHFGGEELLKKRIPPERFAKFHAAFEKHPVWSLMFPAMLPPPTPFKIIALTAAVSEMGLGEYLLAILAGRFVRFFLLAIFTLIFGPGVVSIIRTHTKWVLVALAAGLLAWLLVRTLKRKRPGSGTGDSAPVPDPSQSS